MSLAVFNLYSGDVRKPRMPEEIGRDEKAERKDRHPSLPAAPKKSIAVLPFENLSEDKANEYFADGIQEEILTRLSRIADLKSDFAHVDHSVSKAQVPICRTSRSNSVSPTFSKAACARPATKSECMCS
jgi:hypothetical protein